MADTSDRAEMGEALALIQEAKADGVAVTCDTAPPYFDLNETAIGDFRTYAKLSPPLRADADRRALRGRHRPQERAPHPRAHRPREG